MTVTDRTDSDVTPDRGKPVSPPTDAEGQGGKQKRTERERQPARIDTPIGRVRRTPGRIRLALLIVLTLFVGIVAGVLIRDGGKTVQQVVDVTTNPREGSALAAGQDCVTLWLNSGADSHDGLTAACSPPHVDLTGQKAGTFQALTTNAYAGQLSPQIRPNYWSVLVSATVLRRDAKGTPENIGLKYYRVAVYVDAHGTPAIRSLPKEVTPPVASSVPDPTLINGNTGTADDSDPRVQVITTYAQNYYISGSVANLLDPSIPPNTVHDPSISAVRVASVKFSNESDNATSTSAVATLDVDYGEGNTTVQTLSLALKRTNQVWTITALDLAPQLNPEGN